MNIGLINTKQPPRIAMYVWQFLPPTGGAEQQCKILSEELARKGVPVFIVTESAKSITKCSMINGVMVYRVNRLAWIRKLPVYVKRVFSKIGIGRTGRANFLSNDGKDNKGRMAIRHISKFFTYDFPNYFFFISSMRLLFLKRDEFDILHVHGAHWVAGFGVQIARLLNKKVVVKEPCCGDWMTFFAQTDRSMKRTKQADLFVGVSEKAFSDLAAAGISELKIRNIPNGVNAANGKWGPNPSREQIAICTSHFMQCFRKGLDVLLQTWKILIYNHNKKVHLRIFGRGDFSPLMRLANELGITEYIHFLGFMDDLRRELLGACLFVLPSRAEGLSNALLEAMSVGIPCVATDIAGNRDLIQSGINGLLVSPEDPLALAKAIVYMLDNLKEATRMGCNAIKTIESEYAISRIAGKYINLYEELCNGQTGKQR